MFVIVPKGWERVVEEVDRLAEEEGRSRSNMLFRLIVLGLKQYGVEVRRVEPEDGVA